MPWAGRHHFPISHMRNREWFAQSHSAGKWQSRDRTRKPGSVCHQPQHSSVSSQSISLTGKLHRFLLSTSVPWHVHLSNWMWSPGALHSQTTAFLEVPGRSHLLTREASCTPCPTGHNRDQHSAWTTRGMKVSFLVHLAECLRLRGPCPSPPWPPALWEKVSWVSASHNQPQRRDMSSREHSFLPQLYCSLATHLQEEFQEMSVSDKNFVIWRA